ncbi:MAG: hypothetical protein V1725_07380 [archaeon]
MNYTDGHEDIKMNTYTLHGKEIAIPKETYGVFLPQGISYAYAIMDISQFVSEINADSKAVNSLQELKKMLEAQVRWQTLPSLGSPILRSVGGPREVAPDEQRGIQKTLDLVDRLLTELK